jgi:hypothetical protein
MATLLNSRILVDRCTSEASLAASSYRDVVKYMLQGFPMLAAHHQLKAAEHALMARAYRFAIIGGRAAPDWVDYET